MTLEEALARAEVRIDFYLDHVLDTDAERLAAAGLDDDSITVLIAETHRVCLQQKRKVLAEIRAAFAQPDPSNVQETI